jgi:hypothetical protein
MSDYHGLYEQHPGGYDAKCQREETLAAAFEKEATP